MSLTLNTRPRKSSSHSCWIAVSTTIFVPCAARLMKNVAKTSSSGWNGRPSAKTRTPTMPIRIVIHRQPPIRAVIGGVRNAASSEPSPPAITIWARPDSARESLPG